MPSPAVTPPFTGRQLDCGGEQQRSWPFTTEYASAVSIVTGSASWAPGTTEQREQHQQQRLSAAMRELPLCPALVLPNREARMKIPVAEIQGDVWTPGKVVTISGPMQVCGRAMLIQEASGKRVMEVNMRRADGESMVASVMQGAMEATASGKPPLQICDSDGEVFCTFAQQKDSFRNGHISLLARRTGDTAEKPPLVVVSGDFANLFLTAVRGADNGRLASAAKNGADLELVMMCGVDTALLLSCMLSAVLFF